MKVRIERKGKGKGSCRGVERENVYYTRSVGVFGDDGVSQFTMSCETAQPPSPLLFCCSVRLINGILCSCAISDYTGLCMADEARRQILILPCRVPNAGNSHPLNQVTKEYIQTDSTSRRLPINQGCVRSLGWLECRYGPRPNNARSRDSPRNVYIMLFSK